MFPVNNLPMKKFLALIFVLYLSFNRAFCSVILPIQDVFDKKDISLKGCQLLDETITKLNNTTILIEVFCNDKLDYEYNWELANIYAYKISKCLIDKGYDQNKIRYIGYGSLDIEKPDEKNIIKISKQEIEDLKQPD